MPETEKRWARLHLFGAAASEYIHSKWPSVRSCSYRVAVLVQVSASLGHLMIYSRVLTW